MPLTDANDDPALITSDNADLDADVNLNANGDAVDGNGAASSDAQDVAQGDRTTLDVVQDVVKERDPAAASSAEGQKEGEADPKATQTVKEPDDENYTDVPFHKHPRFQQVLKKAKDNQADADRYRNVEGFLSQHSVSAEEASNVLTILAMSKTDAPGAWAKLKPIVQQLLIDAGEVLPQDLKARVDSGELTVEAANELAKANARATGAVKARETDAQRQERKRQEDHTIAIRSAANDWEADRAKRDPNFEAKKQSIFKELAWIHTTEGKGDTPVKVRDQLDRAYKAVGAVAAPARRVAAKAPAVGEATRPRPAVGSASQTQQRAQEPAGALKFIKQAVANRGVAA